ncbi:nuclear transport factor 2 family protein [Nocardia sp. NPDC059240]|uniref:nuclear transport factor 2 family protein n=1 Tax=Nocardia sp. NPDC059240 TaxID=3346786 RepID=UPI003693400E
MPLTPVDLMRRNLLDVFNEPDPTRRAAVIAETYSEDVIWHEPDRINHGRKEFEHRATEMLAETPGWIFHPAGPASELDDIGHLAFQYGPPTQPALVTGMDIARTHNGRITELYTLITSSPEPS